MVGEKYINAVREGAGALPLLIPALTPPLEPAQILASVDGLLLPALPPMSRPAIMAARRRGGTRRSTRRAMRPRSR